MHASSWSTSHNNLLVLLRVVFVHYSQEILKLGYSEKFWLKYDFYFAYCEAGFDAKYIHDFHVTWEKRPQGQAGATHAAVPGPAASGVGAVVATARGDVAGWVRQELPSDSVTQVRLPASAGH